MKIKTMLFNTIKEGFTGKQPKNNNKHTISSINKQIAELEAERQRLEDIQTNTTEISKREMLTEFHRLCIGESEQDGYWSAIMYEYTEEEDEDYYMDEPLFSITGENCYKCGGYLDVCRVEDIDKDGRDKHGAYRNYADSIKCKCGKYVHWLSCKPDPRNF